MGTFHLHVRLTHTRTHTPSLIYRAPQAKKVLQRSSIMKKREFQRQQSK